MERDEAFHRTLVNETRKMIGGHLALADFMSLYIETRARQELPRFWSEITFKSKQVPDSGSQLDRWHRMRTSFWIEMLVEFEFAKTLSPIISAYTVMEEMYAYALIDDVQYRLLLNETTRAMTAVAFGVDNSSDRHESLSEALDILPLQSAIGFSDSNEVRKQLLQHAVDAIVAQGIGTVNQRKLARKADVSTSMIAYHFSDMATFLNEAIWHALIQDIPDDLDPDREDAEMPETMSEWFATLNRYVSPPFDTKPAGFYTAFARLTGQACLLTKFQPALHPLVQYLRSLEGWGTYRVGQHIHSRGAVIHRDHAAAFGLWIKAEGALREAGLVDVGRDACDIAEAARLILPPFD